MNKYKWKDEALFLDYDTNIFFEKYEDDELLRPAIDLLCSSCPVRKECFSVGISGIMSFIRPPGVVLLEALLMIFLKDSALLMLVGSGSFRN